MMSLSYESDKKNVMKVIVYYLIEKRNKFFNFFFYKPHLFIVDDDINQWRPTEVFVEKPMEETDEIKISLDGNYCVTRDGDTARKLKKMLDLKYNVGAVVDGEIKSSSLTIQIKSENEYVVK